MLEEVLHQQRMLQIQHQPQSQVPVQTGPTQNPLLYLSQQQSASPPPSNVFASCSLFDAPAVLQSQPQPSVALQQHGPWQPALETSSASCSSSCYSSSLSPVASAAYLLEARLHISQQPHPPLHIGLQQQQPDPTTTHGFPVRTKPAVWGAASNVDPNMQDLGLSGQSQLSSCVMVK